MKVNADQLGTHLKKSPATQVYLVSGDEPLLVQESTDQIRQYLRQQGFTEREVHQVERGFDWAEILFSANSMSLFADRKIIEIRSSGTLGEPAGSAVMSFLAQSSEDTALLLITGRLDASLQKRKWFTQMEKHVMWVPIWPIERRDLPGWMARRLKQAGLKADKDVINCLCDRVEGNLLAAAQEIERLALLVSDGVLTIEQVMNDVADSTRYDVFKMIDTAMSGNAARAVKMLGGLKSQGVEPLSLLGLLARELRTLVKMAVVVQKGQTVDAVMTAARVWHNRKAVVGRALKTLSYDRFLQLQQQLALLDGMAKGQASGNVWDELANIFLLLGGAPVITGTRFN